MLVLVLIWMVLMEKNNVLMILDTIADLQKIPSLFKQRGYSDEDINNLMHGNWLRFLKNAWK